ncbi:MAG: methyltransferase domain-containing protein [Epulopiscium sp.]|nr:methyltransferase domain-containing protein [Candidatus Epulonipiscium sp.]
MLLGKMTTMVHQLLQTQIQPGQVFIDGTVGNGYDTLFLAQCIGPQGKVFGFDIQKKALIEAELRLKKEGAMGQAIFIHDCHSKLDQYVKEPIDGAMFNLGYLPKGDPRMITTPQTTLVALEKCISLLKPGGVITIVSYYGHKGGEEEKNAVDEYVKKLDERTITVGCLSFNNRKQNPPILYIIEKKKNRKRSNKE